MSMEKAPTGQKEHSPEIEIPEDIIYEPDNLREYYVTRAGMGKRRISGTFDGREIKLEHASWTPDKPDSWEFSGEIDGKEIPDAEAESLWKKTLPAVLEYEKVRKSKEEATRAADKEKRRLDEIEERKRDEEFAAAIEKASVPLKQKLEGIECSKKDKKFLEGVIKQVAELLILEPINENAPPAEQLRRMIFALSLPEWRNFMPENEQKEYDKQREEYRRRKGLLYQLMGVDEKSPQVWEGPTPSGFSYTDSRVYNTTFPDVIVKESYGRHGDAHTSIERNSRFQKKAKSKAGQ
ncbi:MAG: hypothetical protein HY457_00485 [Parcubacteria group bacterium]|nr:hypothetical protein [Parcubacteria group bacterium]